MIKNLAQLKRTLVEGSEFEITGHWKAELIGERRRVNYADTTGIYTIVPGEPENKTTLANRGRGSYLEWGKAPFWQFGNGVCGLYEDKEHSRLVIEIKLAEHEGNDGLNRRADMKPISKREA